MNLPTTNLMLRKSVLRHFCLPLLFTATAFASEPGVFDRTLIVTGPVALDVRSDPGGVTIRAGSATTFVVHATVKPLYGRLDLGVAEHNIVALVKNPPIEQNGNSIRVGYPKSASLLGAVTVHYDIQTPRATSVHAYTESGGIRIKGISGPIETTTASGRTEVIDIEADLKVTGRSGAVAIRNAGDNVLIRTTSGGIQLQSARGNVDTETTRGRTEISDVGGQVHSSTHSSSIRIAAAKGAVEARNTSGSIDALQLGGAVHAETTSGAIRISQEAAGPIRALTGSGSINVELVKGAGYRLDAASKSGKIAGKAANKLLRTRGAHVLRGQIGTGGPLVDLDTRSSKIEVD